GNLSFITEKCSASGRYPVENGQILPARIDQNQRNLLTRIGRLANLLVGQCNNSFHNEIKIKADATQAAIVEPNRRPAGMKIWSLAERVYGLNFYHLWVDSVLGETLPTKLPNPQGIAATIMLGCPHDGYLILPSQSHPQYLFDKTWEIYQRNQITNDLEWFDFIFFAKTTTWVKSIPQENGDFLAQVCIYSPHSDVDILGIKNAISDCWQQAIASYIYQQKVEIAA
ncbi:MAG: ATP-grasp domain-containing protein, partial [Waterburya sp.]